jgi:sugar lactone lactonase YvrE
MTDMGHRHRLGLSSSIFVLVTAVAACGSSNPPGATSDPTAGGTGGRASGAGQGGGRGGSGGTTGSPSGGTTGSPSGGSQGGGDAPTGSGGATPPDTSDAATEAGAPTGTGGSGDANSVPAPDVAAPPALGAFPLDAIKAAKAEVYVKANAHLEGPSWRNGEVFFAADGTGWGLMRIDADRKLYRYQPKLLPVGSYALADGSILFGDHDRVVEQIFPDGKIGVLATDFAGQPIEFANDVTLDGAGNVYTSGRHSGFIYRISPAGEVVKVASGVNLPNGVEVDPTSKFLYFVAGASIMRLSLPATGTDFGKPEMVIGGRQPDGMMFDAWGNLWFADWGAGHLVVIGPDGKTITTVESGGAPINLCPGGKDNDTIYVATDFKGIYKIGPIAGFRGFLHPGAAKYTLKTTLDMPPANTPVP